MSFSSVCAESERGRSMVRNRSRCESTSHVDRTHSNRWRDDANRRASTNDRRRHRSSAVRLSSSNDRSRWTRSPTDLLAASVSRERTTYPSTCTSTRRDRHFNKERRTFVQSNELRRSSSIRSTLTRHRRRRCARARARGFPRRRRYALSRHSQPFASHRSAGSTRRYDTTMNVRDESSVRRRADRWRRGDEARPHPTGEQRCPTRRREHDWSLTPMSPPAHEQVRLELVDPFPTATSRGSPMSPTQLAQLVQHADVVSRHAVIRCLLSSIDRATRPLTDEQPVVARTSSCSTSACLFARARRSFSNSIRIVRSKRQYHQCYQSIGSFVRCRSSSARCVSVIDTDRDGHDPSDVHSSETLLSCRTDRTPSQLANDTARTSARSACQRTNVLVRSTIDSST
jgi:hypothetical protein